MTRQTVTYKDVRIGDRIWNKRGYTSKLGHWTAVTSIEHLEGFRIGLKVADGYTQYGDLREAIAVER